MEMVTPGEFYRRKNYRGSEYLRDMGPYEGKSFVCGCGKVHSFSCAIGKPGERLVVVHCPDFKAVNLVKRTLFTSKLKTLYATTQDEVDAFLEFD